MSWLQRSFSFDVSISTDTSWLADKEELNWPGAPRTEAPEGPPAVRCHFTRQSHKACLSSSRGSFRAFWGKKHGAGSEAESGRAPDGRSPPPLSADLLLRAGERRAYQRAGYPLIPQERSAGHGMGKRPTRSAFKQVPTLSRLLPL